MKSILTTFVDLKEKKDITYCTVTEVLSSIEICKHMLFQFQNTALKYSRWPSSLLLHASI